MLGFLAITSLILAYFSWKFVETPFRDKYRFNRQKIFLFGAIGSAIFIVIGLIGYLTNGFEYRFTSRQREVIAYESYAYKDVYREDVCLLERGQSFKTFTEACKASVSRDALLIWGDSHAGALSFGLRQVFANVIQYTASGCPPIKDAVVSWRPYCKGVNDFVMREIASKAPAKILLHANWSLYKELDPVRNIHKTIAYIRSVSPATEITIVGPVPQWAPSLPIVMLNKGIALDGMHYLGTSTLNDLRVIDEELAAEAKKNGVKFMSALKILCKDEKCLVATSYRNGVTPTAWDYGHLTEGGSVYLANKLIEPSVSMSASR